MLLSVKRLRQHERPVDHNEKRYAYHRQRRYDTRVPCMRERRTPEHMDCDDEQYRHRLDEIEADYPALANRRWSDAITHGVLFPFIWAFIPGKILYLMYTRLENT